MKISVHLSARFKATVLLAVLCGALGCIDFDRELSRICERNPQNPACGNTDEQPPEPAAQPPEIVSTSQSLDLPQGGIFSFRVEARDPQDSPLRFSWTCSSGAFASLQTDTPASSEIRWLPPPC